MAWPSGAPSWPPAPFSVGERRKGFGTSVGAAPASWRVNVGSERGEPRGSESARVCKELLCVWYFEKMAECLFQPGMPPPRQRWWQPHVGIPAARWASGLRRDGLLTNVKIPLGMGGRVWGTLKESRCLGKLPSSPDFLGTAFALGLFSVMAFDSNFCWYV